MRICPTCKQEYGGGEVFCPVDAARLVTHSQFPPPKGKDDDPLVGQVLDRYKVVRKIGEGGMGFVYEAIHTVIEKRVAIKLLRKDFSSKADVVERFRQEAKSASRIGHEHIIDISDFGETKDGESYFVMEFLEGQDLANVLAKEGALPARRAVDILAQCTRALGAAHAKGIIHRDMKPENVFLVRRGDNPDFVKIVDFGIAKMNDIETPGEPGRKLTKTGMIFGTPEYMSPEQAAGRPVDHRVDIYAVGVILFELMTGRVPFVGDSFMGILTQHMFEPVPGFAEVNPTVVVPLEIEAVILKALAKRPEDRYQTMDELTQALVEAGQGRMSAITAESLEKSAPLPAPATQGRGVTALRVDETDARLARPTQEEAPRKGRGLLWAAVVVLLAAGAGAAYVLTRPPEAQVVVTPPPAPAPPVADDAGLAAAEPAVPADTGIDAGPVDVELSIDSRPTGATVRVDGGEATCAPAPCALRVPPGVEVKLIAELDGARGELTLVPAQPMAVVIPLEARPAVRTPRPDGPRRPPGGSTSGRAGDLRVPDIFR